MSASSPHLLRLQRLWRLMHLGRNPLARGSDRVEAVALLTVMLLALLAVPFAASAGSETRAQALETARQEMSSRHRGTAVLLANAPPRPYGDTRAVSRSGARVRVQWVLSGGSERTGFVRADYDTPAGSEVPIWLDDNGELTSAPTTPGDAARRAVGAAVSIWLATVVVLSAGFWLTRKGLDRLRHAQWAREWERIEQDRSWS